MSHRIVLTFFIYLFSFALAFDPPSYGGYRLVWSDVFNGDANSKPSSRNWVTVTGNHNFNNEFQTYSSSRRNLRLSGEGTLQIIPQSDRSAPGGWTSARIESRHLVKPHAGKITIVEASLRLAGNPSYNKHGIWPAFWMIGDSYRHGVNWPRTGELDIMENIDGQGIVYGVAHCDRAPGGICKESTGLAGTASLPDHDFHTWRVAFNRKSNNWRKQSVTWYRDSRPFHRITGSEVGNSRVWGTLCRNSMYIILNVAVGGDWPGAPNYRTRGGLGSMMEVGYVAHYESK